MPKIHSSADLRNNYNDISKFCHEYNEPGFMTKNGKGALAVMSIAAYEELVARSELYAKVQRGLDDVQSGRVISADDFVNKLRSRRTYNGGI